MRRLNLSDTGPSYTPRCSLPFKSKQGVSDTRNGVLDPAFPEFAPMSVLGTSVAAGVAQTTHQAQQVARDRDTRRTPPAQEDRHIQDTLEPPVRGLEDADAGETRDHLRVGDEAQQQQTADAELRWQHAEAEEERPDQPEDRSEVSTTDDRLYRHLDIRA